MTLATALLITQGYGMSDNQFQTQLAGIRATAESGALKKADEKTKQILDSASDLTEEQKRTLKFELVRTERIRKNYSVTEEKLRGWLLDDKRGAANYTDEQFEQLEAEGYFDFKLIDGEKLYVGASRSNLFFRHDEIVSISDTGESNSREKLVRDEMLAVMKSYNANSVPPDTARHFEMTYTIKVKPGIVKEGELVECWMPFPQEFAWQKDIELLKSSPAVHTIAPADYPMRSLYFQQTATGDGEMEFQATWRMSRTPQHTIINPAVVPEKNSDPTVEIFTKEQAPHVMFTPELVALEKSIAGDLTNPAEKARAYYDWMKKNIKYSYAREYSTLQNISQYVCDNGYGDCGQIALMFITLCRIGGVPARWSTGWNLYPNNLGIHDWSEIYLEPYGWVHVDANWGIYTEREFPGMTPDEKQKIADYYFGGMDAYRFTVNRNHGIQFTPPKTDFRSDTVDFQRGELEANDRNLYYGDFSYSLNVKYLDGHSNKVYKSLEEEK